MSETPVFKALIASPISGINSVDSHGTRTLEKEFPMPNGGSFSVESSMKSFGLTPLEKEVIGLTATGYTIEERAQRIGISKPALRLHITSICEKLRVSNEFELLLFALTHQLINSSVVAPPSD